MTRLRLAMATRFPYVEADAFSGLYQVSVQLCNALAQRPDVELHVVSTSRHVRRPERRGLAGYTVTFLPLPPNAINYGSFYTLAALTMRRELLRLKPDIVNCQATTETALAAVLSGLPLATTIHGIYSAEAVQYVEWKARVVSRIQRIVERWYVRRLRHVIASSPYVTRFVRQFNVRAAIYELTNPIDPAFFELLPERPQAPPATILQVGAITNRKGQDLMVEALALLAPAVPEARLTVVGNTGEPEYERAVRQRVSELGLEQRVAWLGPVSDERLRAEMRAHQILCLPSREETRPMSLAQAMAVGNICVASDAGGIPDMIREGDNGFLFARGDAAALAASLRRALALTPAEASTLRQRARGEAERLYRSDGVAAQYMEVFQTVLASERRRHP